MPDGTLRKQLPHLDYNAKLNKFNFNAKDKSNSYAERSEVYWVRVSRQAVLTRSKHGLLYLK
jgi:hypothetical protein